MIKFLSPISAMAGAPAGAVVLKTGQSDLGKRTAAVLHLLALLARGLLASLGKPPGRVGSDGEGAPCSLPAVVLAPGPGAGARHPQGEDVGGSASQVTVSALTRLAISSKTPSSAAALADSQRICPDDPKGQIDYPAMVSGFPRIPSDPVKTEPDQQRSSASPDKYPSRP